MDPSKLAEFSQNKMVPAVAEKYDHHIADFKIPQGLKKHLELAQIKQMIDNGKAGFRMVSIL